MPSDQERKIRIALDYLRSYQELGYCLTPQGLITRILSRSIDLAKVEYLSIREGRTVFLLKRDIFDIHKKLAIGFQQAPSGKNENEYLGTAYFLPKKCLEGTIDNAEGNYGLIVIDTHTNSVSHYGQVEVYCDQLIVNIAYGRNISERAIYYNTKNKEEASDIFYADQPVISGLDVVLWINCNNNQLLGIRIIGSEPMVITPSPPNKEAATEVIGTIGHFSN